MKTWVKKYLICPECRDEEIPLGLDIEEEIESDVVKGTLLCHSCKRQFPIQNGVAVILPDKTLPVISDPSGYNSTNMLSSYLWSHFCDILKEPEATDAYRIWSSFFRKTKGVALDIGCAVGRLSFELTKTHSQVVGIDTSMAFIEKARELMQNRRIEFDLIVEGHITEKRTCDFANGWNFDQVDFIVADALALPFAKNTFKTVTSINILEKVSRPLRHLMDINRVLNKSKSTFVFSDPFSWDESVSAPQHWLGGVVSKNGDGNRRGIDNVIRYMWGKDDIFNPPLEIIEKGSVAWKIRKTENLWEHITSQFAVGVRK